MQHRGGGREVKALRLIESCMLRMWLRLLMYLRLWSKQHEGVDQANGIK